MKEKTGKRKPNIQDWGLRDKKYLLFAGNLNKSEGAHYLIEAFKQLEDTAKTPNNFKLAIAVSQEDAGDEDYVKYLQLISQKRDNIIFFCAWKKNSMKMLFSHAYLYVQPSELFLTQEVLHQAMKYGVAILVSDIKENIELVGQFGFSFKNKSMLDLRDRLAFLLSRPKEVLEMGERAKDEMQKSKQAEDESKIILDKHNKRPWNWKKLLKKCV